MSLVIEKLVPPRHVSTPMGKWGFFKQLDFSSLEKETRPTVEVEGITTTDITKDACFQVLEKELDQLTGIHYNEFTGGLHVHVQQQPEGPIVLRHTVEKDAFRTTLITIEPGITATIIELVEGNAKICSLATEIVAKENSHVVHAHVQQFHGTLLARKAAKALRDSSVTWFELNANRGNTFSRVATFMEGENSETGSYSIYLGKGNDFIDFGAQGENLAMHTNTNLMTRGVLTGKALAIYEGVLHIGEKAAESTAFQEEDCLLLSKNAEVKASPMLYIDNNNVKCSHAATAGHVDKEKLFYLMSRGLSPESAQQLLVKGFVWPVLERLGEHAAVVGPYVEPIVEAFAEGTHE